MMQAYRLIPWSAKARDRRRRLTADRAWQQHERESEIAVQMLLDQAANMPAERTARVYMSASRFPDAPLLTPGQEARGHGGRP